MINISHKKHTLRRAKATGKLLLDADTVKLIRDNNVKKGDIREIIKIAGIQGAKETSNRVMFAHPIPIDGVNISTELLEDGIKVTAEVETVWKTGVEVEAITAVTGALLNALDVLKPHTNDMTMTDIRVVRKTGGKNDFTEQFDPPLDAAVLVISDSTYKGDREDKSGKIISELLQKYEIEIDTYEVLPDNKELIYDKVNQLIEKEVNLIITTGGTGFGPNDMTPEAVRPLIEIPAEGIAEQMRSYGSGRTPYAMLSREVAGINKNSLIITMPGSSNGARESMQALFPGMLHIFRMMWGGGHAPPENQ